MAYNLFITDRADELIDEMFRTWTTKWYSELTAVMYMLSVCFMTWRIMSRKQQIDTNTKWRLISP